MMYLSKTLFIVLMVSSQFAFSHARHDAISTQEALKIAEETIKDFVAYDYDFEIGKLPESWLSITSNDIKLIKRGDEYFIISAVNASENKTLYVLLSISGDLFGANFTGEFKGL